MAISAVTSVLVFVVMCVVVDVWTRRIPNVLTASAIVVGVALNGLLFGVPGLLHSAGGLAVNVAVLFVPFALGGIGGGDVKMMGAVGAFLGPGLALSALAYGLVCGGVIMLVHLARIGRLREKLTAARDMLGAAFLARSTVPLVLPTTNPAAVSLPYSVPLGIGTIIALASAGALGGAT